MRRALTCAAVASLVIPVTLATTSHATPVADDAGGATLNILPPGSVGNANVLQALTFEANGSRPANFANQLDMYDALNTVSPYSLQPGQLTKYYKDATIGGGTVVSTQ